MSDHTISIELAENGHQTAVAHVPTGTLLSEAARLAGIDIIQPCGGQGRCGRCLVQVVDGQVRRRSTLRLTACDIELGFALACQAVIEGDASIIVPAQEKVERRLSTDRTVAEVAVPAGYDFSQQSIGRQRLTLEPPSLDDQTDDWNRLQRAIRQQTSLSQASISLGLLQQIGGRLRQGEWQVTAVYDRPDETGETARLIDLRPGHTAEDAPLWAAAVDIGTTTVTVWLVDLISGQVVAQAAEYNSQIARGEDVISRIIYATKNRDGGLEMAGLVRGSINTLLERACQRAKIEPSEIVKLTIAGNSTMIHLFLNIPAESIRLMPFVTAVNNVPLLKAKELGLIAHPEASVDCLPGVASYVGADISAGVLASGMDDTDQVNLFIDIGTNGEIVLGSNEWLATCACSAGPAFEGAGVLNGMRATRGAIEEVWINSHSYEPTCRVIGNVPPQGICGSGLISLLSELFLNGLLDKGGNFNRALGTDRIRQGEHGLEYVVAWGPETRHGRDIVITHVDVDNLLRAKAAIYAGFTVLADRVGVPLEHASQVLIGGAFGKYINVEKAVQIGLLPDMAWDQFRFLGNTSVMGAYRALLDRQARARIDDIASRMTYIELSADNNFYDAFTSALFLPHTDMQRFPSVIRALAEAPIPESDH
jgi:uncharacterized 2Fe-2S/4Fe-4S cluster protein (DUF4445 family)